MKYDKAGIFFFLFFFFLIVWGIFANTYGPELVSWVMILILISVGILYWRYEPSRKIINKILSVLSNIFLSLFEKEEVKRKVSPARKELDIFKSKDPLHKRVYPSKDIRDRVMLDANGRCQIWRTPSARGQCKTGLHGVSEATKFQYHHINGKPGDNRAENILYICGSCHSQLKSLRWLPKKDNPKDFEFTHKSYDISEKYFELCKKSYIDKSARKEIVDLDKKYFQIFKTQ